MSDDRAFDPLAMTRTWAAQWEKLVNEHGTDWLSRPEAAQAMQAFGSAAVRLQAIGNEASAKVLAAANLPSRADVEALGTRLAAIEAAVARIEAQLRTLAPAAPAPARPAVRRTRKPPPG